MLHGRLLTTSDGDLPAFQPARFYVLDEDAKPVDVHLYMRRNGALVAVPVEPEPELSEPTPAQDPKPLVGAGDPRRSPINPDDFVHHG